MSEKVKAPSDQLFAYRLLETVGWEGSTGG